LLEQAAVFSENRRCQEGLCESFHAGPTRTRVSPQPRLCSALAEQPTRVAGALRKGRGASGLRQSAVCRSGATRLLRSRARAWKVERPSAGSTRGNAR
jgi:hypothetical protein